MKNYMIIFAVTFFSLSLLQGNVWAVKGSMMKEQDSSQMFMKEVKVDKSLVCMMNDKYMGGKKQIPIKVEEKTYYGCCQGCVTALQYKRSTRYSIDPFSGKEVDKAKAYIVLKEDGSKGVWYFESVENYLKFINQ